LKTCARTGIDDEPQPERRERDDLEQLRRLVERGLAQQQPVAVVEAVELGEQRDRRDRGRPNFRKSCALAARAG
jgi:hypothetical protein